MGASSHFPVLQHSHPHGSSGSEEASGKMKKMDVDTQALDIAGIRPRSLEAIKIHHVRTRLYGPHCGQTRCHTNSCAI